MSIRVSSAMAHRVTHEMVVEASRSWQSDVDQENHQLEEAAATMVQENVT
jgi:hypothetical protein